MNNKLRGIYAGREPGSTLLLRNVMSTGFKVVSPPLSSPSYRTHERAFLYKQCMRPILVQIASHSWSPSWALGLRLHHQDVAC